jgi:methionyl-tRNA synthetase
VNIASRCAGFVERLNQGRTASTLLNSDLWQRVQSAGDSIAELYDKRLYSHAMREIMGLTDEVNEYISTEQPWMLAKDQATQQRAVAVASDAINLFRLLMTYLAPVLPETAQAASTWLGSDLRWDRQIDPLLDHPLSTFQPLINRIDPKAVGRLQDAAKAVSTEPAPSNGKPTMKAADPAPELVDYDQFAALDLRVARIVKAEPVEGADKLLRLQLDLGERTLQVFAGIKAHYTADSLKDRLTICVANLKPRKMKFGTSEGMVLCAENAEGLHLLAVDSGSTPGDKVS